MRFGHFMMGTQGGAPDQLLEQAIWAESLGFNTVWFAERHGEHAGLLWPDPFIAASWVAAQTEHIGLGFAASILPMHHPMQLAERVLLLDRLSKGRVTLGVTRGGIANSSLSNFGFELDQRHQRFEESVDILDLAFSGRAFSYAGQCFSLENAKLELNSTDVETRPVVFVANSDESMAFAARRGAPIFLNGIESFSHLADRHARFSSLISEAEYFFHPGYVLNRFIFTGRTTKKARDIYRRALSRFLTEYAPDLAKGLEMMYGHDARDTDFLMEEIFIVGDAEHCYQRLLASRDLLPLRETMLSFNLASLEHHHCLDSMSRFAIEVMPELQKYDSENLNLLTSQPTHTMTGGPL